MKNSIEVKQGAFTAEGEAIEHAEIVIRFYDLELPEYRSTIATLTKEFNIDYTSTIFRHNRDVMVKGQDAVHDANNPHEGDRSRL
jgi:hypothetical protein